MGDVNKFVSDMDAFKRQTQSVVGKVVRRAAFVAMNHLVQGSPVDTGRFQSSWFVGIGEPNRSVAVERTSSGKASEESLARLSALTPATVTGRERVIISNNLPYAESLANGSSTQAPSGWIDAVAMAVKGELG